MIEYKYSRDQIQKVKEQLYQKMKEYVAKREEEGQGQVGGDDDELEFRDEGASMSRDSH